MPDSKTIVEKLELQPHPEGGYFKEVYRSNEIIKNEGLPERFIGDRNFGTSIYYLLEKEQYSTFHKLKSDETWHFYYGSSLLLHVIDESGKYNKIVLGNNLTTGEVFQHTVLRNCWFAAEVADKNSFSLIGVTVAPGFDFNDFEMGKREELISKFPEQKELITRLTIN
jgi:predicted cupin superfamily sugar epimerase